MIADRLDPALRQFAAARTDLSASVLGVVRDSLNQRRAEASRDVNTVGVDIEDREARSIPVRIYRGGPSPAPAVIYCHSGAFVLGNLDTDHRQCVEFARRGRCTVISVDYRLAPEDPYPAGLRRCGGGAGVGSRQRANLGIDTARLAVAGSSAGAALAALLAQRAAEGTAPPVVFQLLHQPVLDDRPMPSKEEFVTTPGIRRASGDTDVAALSAGEPAPADAVPARAAELAGVRKHIDHVLGARPAARRSGRLRTAAHVGRRRDRAACVPRHLPRVRLAAPGVGDQSAAVRAPGRGAAAGAVRAATSAASSRAMAAW